MSSDDEGDTTTTTRDVIMEYYSLVDHASLPSLSLDLRVSNNKERWFCRFSFLLLHIYSTSMFAFLPSAFNVRFVMSIIERARSDQPT